MEHQTSPGLHILKTETLMEGPFLSFREREFIDRAGVHRTWTFAERPGLRQAAVIIARTPQEQLILVRQFRVPMAAWIYEFPAGLVDPGESIEQAALRELAEETGYSGRVLSLSPPLPSAPGLSSECVRLVQVAADPVPAALDHEDSEAIEVVCMNLSRKGITQLLANAEAHGDLVDAKLQAYLEACQQFLD